MASTIKVDTIENIAGSGNVSLGSGHNLVVPGNATVGGTFGVTGASTLTGDTQITGNLGVGVAPERKFHVEGSGAEFSLVDTSRPTDKKTINMFIDANGKGNIRMMNDAQNAGNAAIVIEGSSPHTTPAVTTPYQPAFQVQGNNGTNVTYGGNQPITHFDATSQSYSFIQGGMSHNASNGRITVPVAGKYFISVTIYDNDSSTGAHRTSIEINSVMIAHTHLEMLNGQSNVTIIANLAANDYIGFQSVYNRAYYMGPNHFYASGYLLG